MSIYGHAFDEYRMDNIIVTEGVKEIFDKIIQSVKKFFETIINFIKKLLGKNPNEKNKNELNENLNNAKEVLDEINNIKGTEDPEKVVQFKKKGEEINKKVKLTAEDMQSYMEGLDLSDENSIDDLAKRINVIDDLAKRMNVTVGFKDNKTGKVKNVSVRDTDFSKKFNDFMSDKNSTLIL